MRRSRSRGRRAAAAAGVVLSLLVVAGCFGGSDSDGSPSGSASPSPSSASPSPVPTGADGLPKPVASTAWALPTETGEQTEGGGPFMRVSVYGIYRHDDVAWLYLGATIVGAGPERGIGNDAAPGYDYGIDGWGVFAPEGTTHNENLSGLTLVDSRSRKGYLAARNGEGNCVCSNGLSAIYGSPIVGGSTTLLRAAFTDIPASQNQLDVLLPRMGGLLPDVPVSDRPTPKVLDSPPKALRTPAPGEDYPQVLVSKLDAHGVDTAQSTVRQLTLPTATMDKSVKQERRKVILAADVLFAFDKATLTGKAKSRIHKAATILRKRAKGTVHVNGYTDAKGSKSYNKDLSKRRAQAVRGKLTGMLNGAGLKLVAKGYGEADPAAPNTTKDGDDNPAGRKLNRRVEIRYTPKPDATNTPAPSTTASPSPRPSGTPTPGKPIAEHKAQFDPLNGSADVDLQIYRLYQHGSLVTLDFGIHVPRSSIKNGDITGSDQVQAYELAAEGPQMDAVTAVTLADTGNRQLYLPGRYQAADNVAYKFTVPQCTCSRAIPPGADWAPYPGETMYLSATYAAPPEGVDTINVHIPQNDQSDYDDPVVIKDIPIEGR